MKKESDEALDPQVWNYLYAEWAAGSHHGGGRHQPTDENRERRRQVTSQVATKSFF